MLFLRKIFLFLLLFHLITLSLFSQQIKKGEVYDYARKIVDTMASESMHGRGYVNGGDSIAANYIKTEFNKFGLRSFTDDSYYQRFDFPVNTFPDTMKLEFDLFRLKDGGMYSFTGYPGKNFLIDPSCHRVYADFGVAVFDSTRCNEKAYKKFCRKTP